MISFRFSLLVATCAFAAFANGGRLGARLVPVDPLLDRVDAGSGTMTFFWNAEPAACGGELAVAVDGGAPVRAVLGKNRRATVELK